MYTSIDRVDVMAETPAGSLLVQTDHRTASEVEEETEIPYWTTVFELMALAGEVIRAREGGAC